MPDEDVVKADKDSDSDYFDDANIMDDMDHKELENFQDIMIDL